MRHKQECHVIYCFSCTYKIMHNEKENNKYSNEQTTIS